MSVSGLADLAKMIAKIQRVDVVAEVARQAADALNADLLRAAKASPEVDGVRITRTDGRGSAFVAPRAAAIVQATADRVAPGAIEKVLR